MGYVLGGVLMAVLAYFGIRAVIQRQKLRGGDIHRCAHCGKPYAGTPAYCPQCGEVLQHGSSRR